MLPRAHRMSNRAANRDTLRRRLSRIFICGGGLHTVVEQQHREGGRRFASFFIWKGDKDDDTTCGD